MSEALLNAGRQTLMLELPRAKEWQSPFTGTSGAMDFNRREQLKHY